MTNLRAFQEEAKNDLLRHARNEIKRNTPTSLLLDAPTGSGKTVIMSQLLKEWIENQKSSDPLLSFIWVAPRSLQKQSYDKIKLIANSSSFTCTLSDDRGKEIDKVKLHDVVIHRTKLYGQVRIEPVPPEEFLIERRCKDINSSNFVAHRTNKTKTELVEMGYDKDKVMS